MPYRYAVETLAEEEPWQAAPSALAAPHRGWLFWSLLACLSVLAVTGGIVAFAALTGGDAPFTAGALADHYPAGSFEALRLADGSLVFARISAENGLVVLDEVYRWDAADGRLVQNRPLSGAGGRFFGAGVPMVVNPGQIVSVEPVDAHSPVGRSIAATEAVEARQRAATTTTMKSEGFQ